MAPPERDLDDEVEERSDGVGEGVLDAPAFEASEALVVGAVVVSVDEGVVEGVVEGVDEGVLEVVWEVVCVAAIKDLGSKAQDVASGSAELREE